MGIPKHLEILTGFQTLTEKQMGIRKLTAILTLMGIHLEIPMPMEK